MKTFHGVPVFGIDNAQTALIFRMAEKLVPAEDVEGIKGFYVSTKFERTFDFLGCYSQRRKGVPQHLKSAIYVTNNSGRERYEVDGSQSPIILINAFDATHRDPVKLLLSIIHEIGHHVHRETDDSLTMKMRETRAHLYAIEYAMPYIKYKTGAEDVPHTDFYFWNVAKDLWERGFTHISVHTVEDMDADDPFSQFAAMLANVTEEQLLEYRIGRLKEIRSKAGDSPLAVETLDAIIVNLEEELRILQGGQDNA